MEKKWFYFCKDTIKVVGPKKGKKKHQAKTVIARFLIFNIDEVESVTKNISYIGIA